MKTLPFARRFRLLAGAFILTVAAVAGNAAPGLTVAGPGTPPVVPYRGLTYTPEGIATVREVARDSERGRQLAAQIFAQAAPWYALSDQQIRELVPAPDAVFAMGNAGDPKTGQSWPRYGRGQIVCSLDRPGTVRSPYTGDIYGEAKRGEPYYDHGQGWVRPSDGKHFYFKGIWNSWILFQLHDAVDALSLAYMLSGDEALADRALLILDELATLRRERIQKLSGDPGTIDGYSFGGENKSFLCYAGNWANERMLQTAFSLDLLGRARRAQAPSAGAVGQSVLENIRDHYFGIYELFYKESRHTLYNHTTILFANQLAQGLLFGRPDAIRESLEVAEVWLAQTVNRDGQYYENAGGYERVGVDYAARLILPLSNYSPENYASPRDYPQPKDYPFQLKFGNDPRWYSAAYLMKYRMMAGGRMIAFGDMWEDRLVIPGRVREIDPRVWCAFGRLLYAQTDNADWKAEIARRYWGLPKDVRNESSLGTLYQMGMSQWFEPARPAETLAKRNSLLETDSDLLPAKMISLLRGGEGAAQRTAFLSGSVHYSHGHDDQLGLLLYAKGMNLNGSYGYPAAGSPAHRGWSIKPASHWTLVVNEDLPEVRYPAKDAPPASLQAWVGNKAGLSAQLVEMSNPFLWQGRIAPDMSEYRRLDWLVDVDADQFYLVDFFRATGGRIHDYFWTGQWLDQADPGKGFSVEGIAPKALPGVWSLAGLNARYRNADFNRKGLSWGERLDPGPTGKMRPSPLSKEPINVDKTWNPPPGNGYGFVYDVRADRTQKNWSAQWDLIDRKNTMRLTLVNNEDQQAMIARSPAMEVNRYHSVAIARRRGSAPLESRFAALVEVAAKDRWPVAQAERLPFAPDAGMGIRLALRNGAKDLVLAGQTPQSELRAGEVRLVGARGFVRHASDGGVQELLLNEGTLLEAGQTALAFAEPAWQARVTALHPDALHNRVEFDRALPSGRLLAGQAFIFTGRNGAGEPQPLQAVTYVAESVIGDEARCTVDFGGQRLADSTIVVDKIEADGAVSSTWPNEILGGRSRDTGYYTGRLVAAAADRSRATLVASYPTRKQFRPLRKGLFKPGETLEFYLVQTGDQARLPHTAALKRTAGGDWTLMANADVTLRLPAKPGERLELNHGQGFAPPDASRVKHANGAVQCVIPAAWFENGPLTLRLR